jgi:hypothetical protein
MVREASGRQHPASLLPELCMLDDVAFELVLPLLEDSSSARLVLRALLVLNALPLAGSTRELNESVLAPEGVRAVVGAAPQIYCLPGAYLLWRLERMLGRRLALQAAGLRIWPGFSTRSAPGDHPCVLALDSESQADLLTEFARHFDLSRPLVREELTVIEVARALGDSDLFQAREQNRSMQLRLERVLTRARRAERALQPVGETGRDAL